LAAIPLGNSTFYDFCRTRHKALRVDHTYNTVIHYSAFDDDVFAPRAARLSIN
jgi:hypothetical protein